jgi:alkylation response protein AidB-like acyl-CoA dehydrogenase
VTDTAELTLLRDSARGVLAKFPEALGLTHGDQLASSAVADVMATGAAQGWGAMLLPESLGGLGLGMREAVVVAAEAGRSLAPGPLLANFVLLPMLAAVSGADWLASLAEEVAGGGTVISFCFTDEGDGPGARRFVEHGSGAATVLRLSLTRQGPSEALSVHRLDAPALRPLQPFDPACPVGELTEAESPGTLRLDAKGTDTVVSAAQLWIASEMLGAAEYAGALSINYAGTRRQFGSPIGANQAVKHRIVDDYILRRNAAVIIQEAAEAWDARRDDRVVLAHAARAAATQAATSSTAHCIQVPGALGFSAESTVHLAYKRVRRLACTLGDAARSRMVIADRLTSGSAA